MRSLGDGLVTATVLNTKSGKIVKKIPDANALIKKTDYNHKISSTLRI